MHSKKINRKRYHITIKIVNLKYRNTEINVKNKLFK